MSHFTKRVKKNLRSLWYRAQGITHFGQSFYCTLLIKAVENCDLRSDISDHLSTIFYHALEVGPKLIVELGTRGGESTRILLAAAELTDGYVLSVDLDDCMGIKVPYPERWFFVRADDVAFGREAFTQWCKSKNLPAQADVIFVDTSHLYEHTKKELETWVPYLSDSGVMILHDTNMGKGVYGRCDGSVGFGWDNQRGVIRAIEEFLGCRYDEKTFFTDVKRGFLLKHYPNCNGLTVLKRVKVVRYPS